MADISISCKIYMIFNFRLLSINDLTNFYDFMIKHKCVISTHLVYYGIYKVGQTLESSQRVSWATQIFAEGSAPIER